MRRLHLQLFIVLFVIPLFFVSAQKHHKYENDRWEQKREKHQRNYDRDDYKDYRKEQKKHYKQERKYWAKAHKYHFKHHVYFPDYDMFYDPYRDGYSYRSRGRWVFVQDIPRAYMTVDFGRAKMVVVQDVPLYRAPETHYHEYERRYPRNPNVNLNISL